MPDWFRSPDWSIEAQRDFETRLGRARPSSRAQYLRIKAVALDEAGESAGATTLLRRIVRDHSEAWPEVAFAHERLGDSQRAAGDLPGAEAEYRLALTVSPSLSGTTGEVHLKLGEVLMESGTDTVAEVEALLTEARPHMTLNSSAFRFNVLMARVAAAKGDVERRQSAAATALTLLDADPQFSRHPTVGRVAATPSLISELQRMAAG
jgi:hypothetical protein